MRGSEGVVDELSGLIKKCLLSGGESGGLGPSADGPSRPAAQAPPRAREATKITRARIYARPCTIQNAPLATCPV